MCYVCDRRLYKKDRRRVASSFHCLKVRPKYPGFGSCSLTLLTCNLFAVYSWVFSSAVVRPEVTEEGAIKMFWEVSCCVSFLCSLYVQPRRFKSNSHQCDFYCHVIPSFTKCHSPRTRHSRVLLCSVTGHNSFDCRMPAFCLKSHSGAPLWSCCFQCK